MLWIRHIGMEIEWSMAGVTIYVEWLRFERSEWRWRSVSGIGRMKRKE